ncbi:hypothetical protein A0H81_07307 [Grifola frondosa]|uniref:Uncharacterized protein n=1 Tax=Grifola frondosa TaxID=5627 RepID=A0A1C7M8K3_GRIFR|nr:hypothetical protein A0H81_07307 [Grifola frondosa]
MGYFADVFQLLPIIIWAAFSSLRTYALSGRNRTLGLLVFILSLVPLGTNMYTFTQRTFFLEPPPIYCASNDGPPAAVTARCTGTLHHLVEYISCREDGSPGEFAVVFGDGFASKWNCLLRVSSHPISFSLLLKRPRQSRSILLIFNVIHIALTLGEQFTYLILLESPISSILISRFILNLRDVDTTSGNITLDTGSPSFVRSHVPNTLAFAPGFVESMGVSLHLGPRSSEECSTISTSDLHAVGDEGEDGAMDLSVIDIHAEGHAVEDVQASCSWGSTL